MKSVVDIGKIPTAEAWLHCVMATEPSTLKVNHCPGMCHSVSQKSLCCLQKGIERPTLYFIRAFLLSFRVLQITKTNTK